MADGLVLETPKCDLCSGKTQEQPVPEGEYWCDTCSSVLCSSCHPEHPRGHDVVKLEQEGGEYDDNDDEVKPGNEDMNTVLDLKTGKASKAKTAPAASSAAAAAATTAVEEKKIVISGEKMTDVLAMFDHANPVDICTRLVNFQPEDEVLEHGAKHEKFGRHFASLRQKAFAVIPNFFNFATAEESDHEKLVSAFAALGISSDKQRHHQSSGGSAAAAFHGFEADLVVPEATEKGAGSSAAAAPVFAKLTALSESLAHGIKLSAQQPDSNTAEMLLFRRNGSFSARDAIPCDGRVSVPGRAGRRVTCMLFSIKKKQHDGGGGAAAAAAAAEQTSSVTLKFLIEKGKLSDITIPVEDGTLLIYLSGAPNEIVFDKKLGEEDTAVVFCKWFW